MVYMLTSLVAMQVPTDPGTWALALAIVATAYVFMRAKRKSDRQFMQDARGTGAGGGGAGRLGGGGMTSEESYRDVYRQALSSQRRVETQMSDLLVELEKMARQMNAQLDTRAARIEELIRQADERLAMLNEALGKEGGRSPRDYPRDESSGGAELEAVKDEAMEVEEPPPPAPIPIDPRHAAVYRLADQGHTAGEIAREVGQPAGEVELILALRRRAR
jgi:hypothetical protein